MKSDAKFYCPVPAFRLDWIECYLNQKASEGYRFISRKKNHFYFQPDANGPKKYFLLPYQQTKEVPHLKEACSAQRLSCVMEDVRHKVLFLSAEQPDAELPPALYAQREKITKHRKQLAIVLNFLFSALCISLIFYYRSGYMEYASDPADFLLHPYELVFCGFAYGIILLLAVGSIFPLLLLLIPRDWIKPPVLQRIRKGFVWSFVFFFFLSHIGIACVQSYGERANDRNPTDQVFYIPLSASTPDIADQTVHTNIIEYEINEAVPQNYMVEQYTADGAVTSHTSCITFADSAHADIEYQYFKKSKYAGEQIPLTAYQKDLLGASDGYILQNIFDSDSQGLIFLKNNSCIVINFSDGNITEDAFLSMIGNTFA